MYKKLRKKIEEVYGMAGDRSKFKGSQKEEKKSERKFLAKDFPYFFDDIYIGGWRR